MSGLLDHVALFAQRSRLDELTSGFKGRRARIETQDIVTGLMVLACFVLAFWALSHLVAYQERRRRLASPWALFLSLCWAHRLPWRQRWLLWRLAREHRLRDPARLFLEPEWFDAAHLGPALEARVEPLAALRARLFAGRPESCDKVFDGSIEEASGRRSIDPTAPLPAPAPVLDVPPWSMPADAGSSAGELS